MPFSGEEEHGGPGGCAGLQVSEGPSGQRRPVHSQ